MGIIYLYLFIIGLFLGSFYFVVGTRLPRNESIIAPRSHCVNCNHPLSWYELIPVFSFIFLGGKCKVCKQHISIQYPIVEIGTGLLFAISFYLFGFTTNTLLSLVVTSLVIIIIITDCKYMVILDEVLLICGILIIAIYIYSGGMQFVLKHLLSGALLFLITLAIKLIGDKAFKQESLGWGDVKLSLIAGLLLGFKLGIMYIFLGAVIALPYAIYVTLKKKTSLIPFGPFLVISMLIIFWNSSTINILLEMLLGI